MPLNKVQKSELRHMVFGIVKAYKAAGQAPSLDDIHSSVTRFANRNGAIYTPTSGDVQEAFVSIEFALRARAAQRVERANQRAEQDLDLAAWFAATRQSSGAPAVGDKKSSPSELVAVDVQSFTKGNKVTDYMSRDEMIRRVTITKKDGTTWKEAVAALKGRYGFDPDLLAYKVKGYVDDKENSYSVTLDRSQGTFRTYSSYKGEYGEGQVNAVYFSVGEAYQRLKSPDRSTSLTAFTDENGDVVYYDVPVKEYTAKRGNESTFPVRVVGSGVGGVYGYNDYCYRAVVRAFPSNSWFLNRSAFTIVLALSA